MQGNWRCHSYSSFIWPFESGNFGKEGRKVEYLENENSFLDKIKNIFHNFSNVFLWLILKK